MSLRKISIIVCTLFLTNLQGKVALIVFTKNRPLQCYALLHSALALIKGITEIYALCATSNDRYDQGYALVAQQYPMVRWFKQDRTLQGRDFAPLLRQIFESTTAPYIMFAVDDIVVINDTDLSLCIKMMQRTNAYGCYLRLGKDTNYCYAEKRPMPVPQLEPLGCGFYSWKLYGSPYCWGYPHTVDMTLYPRELIDEATKLPATSPNIFEGMWSGKRINQNSHAICYETSRVINIPLNLVQHDYPKNHCAHRYTPEHLLNLFLEGWRIDVQQLYQFPHNAPHMDIDIPLVRATKG